MDSKTYRKSQNRWLTLHCKCFHCQKCNFSKALSFQSEDLCTSPRMRLFLYQLSEICSSHQSQLLMTDTKDASYQSALARKSKLECHRLVLFISLRDRICILLFCHSHSHSHSALCNVYPAALDRNRRCDYDCDCKVQCPFECLSKRMNVDKWG